LQTIFKLRNRRILMAIPEQYRIRNLGSSFGAAAVGLAIVAILAAAATPAAQAQTFNVIHTFTAGQDGADPVAGVTMDAAGNLYGTADSGGDLNCDAPYGCGTVYRLKRFGSSWVFNPLYSFAGGSDGTNPDARVIFGPDGPLYGTTELGGGRGSCVAGLTCGTVLKLQPPVTACRSVSCPWIETVLYRFAGAPGDGGEPGYGDLIFDKKGNIHGTTFRGGMLNCSQNRGCGTFFELTSSNGNWVESALYEFSGKSDGYYPDDGVVFDSAGNFYGTASGGGSHCSGTVFQLTPSGSGLTENTLYNFQDGSDGGSPYSGLIFDQSGNLYGTTTDGGTGGGGTVFELSPGAGGTWAFTPVYSFTGVFGDFCGPVASLVLDGAGDLYGTTYCDGKYGYGTVFKLTPTPAPPWTYTSLHDFTGGSDGGNPISNVLLHPNGKLYGTTALGGAFGVGVVWEITP
jgi:uncharacterized repeat protein (TIGR03803 family)